MKISFLIPRPNFLEDLIIELRELRHEVLVNDCTKDCDVILSMNISQVDNTEKFHRQFPDIPIICYNWDLYDWVKKEPRENEFDYKKYGKLLKKSKEIWCPSKCTVKKTKEWYGLDSIVIKSFSRFYDSDILSERYILNPLRPIPDRNYGWVEKVCKELDIPLLNRENKYYRWEEYKNLVAECLFIVSPYYEASTGGLTLIEGTYLGKPCLVSDSPYNGVRDYLGDRAYYFDHNDYEDLKTKIKEMWDNTPKLDLKDCQKWVKDNYGVKGMAEKIHQRLLKL